MDMGQLGTIPTGGLRRDGLNQHNGCPMPRTKLPHMKVNDLVVLTFNCVADFGRRVFAGRHEIEQYCSVMADQAPSPAQQQDRPRCP